MTETAAPRQRTIGPIKLSPGVAPAQVFIFIAISCILSITNSFASLMQPLVLRQQLHVPQAQQGMLAGELGSIQQFGLILCLGVAGSLTDVIGRRWLLLSSIGGFAFCLLVYPLVPSVWLLFAIRLLWGIAFTGWTVGGATKAIDYPDDLSRGKFLSLVLVTTGVVGALSLTFVSSRLPAVFQSIGLSPTLASRYSFWTMGALALFGTALTLFGLAPDRPGRRSSAGRAQTPKAAKLYENIRDVLVFAGQRPKLAMILIVGCAIRSDYVVLGTFLSLWIVSASAHLGVSAIAATKTAGGYLGIMAAAGFVSPLIFGIIADKVDRAYLLTISLALTTVCFLSFGLVTNVTGIGMLVVVIATGFTDGGQNVSAQALLAQEAPEHLRGSAMGLFAFLGTVSLLGINIAGGYCFDHIGFSSPLVMEGVLHGIFLIVAIGCLRIAALRDRTAGRTGP